MATSLILLSIRRLTSSSMLLRLLMCVVWMSMLVSGGMMKVATVVFVSGSSGSGRRSFHMGSIFILWVLSSYLRRPCSERNSENSVSLLVRSPSWSDSSSMLCHAPFLMIVKNLSMLTVIVCYKDLRWYFSPVEPVV